MTAKRTWLTQSRWRDLVVASVVLGVWWAVRATMETSAFEAVPALCACVGYVAIKFHYRLQTLELLVRDIPRRRPNFMLTLETELQGP